MNNTNLSERDWERIVNGIEAEDCGEDVEFQHWLTERVERMAVYSELLKARMSLQTVTLEEVEDKNSVWNSIQIEIEKAEQASSKEHAKKRRGYLVAAAVVVPLIFLGLGYLIGAKSSPEAEKLGYKALLDLESSYDLGKQRPMLVLGSGGTVDLNKSTELLESDGTVIRNQPSKVLRYDTENAKGPASLNTIIVPRGKTYQLVLEDGTKVYVNSGSMVRFPTAFRGKRREVELIGEAYFNVKKNPDMPFVVNVKGVRLKVYGTSFNVDAHNLQQGISTTLVEGKVTMEVNDRIEYAIHPNERVSYNLESGCYSVERNVDVSLYTSWKDGLYRFDNQDLESIMERLSLWYSYEILFADEAVKGMKFTGVAEKGKPIQEILDLMVSLKKIRYEVKNGVIFIYKAR